MRARMHNLIWGDNSNNGQQPSWVLNNNAAPNNGLLDKAYLGDVTAKNDLWTWNAGTNTGSGEVQERIDYYVGTGSPSDRANKYIEVDVYNESYHTGPNAPSTPTDLRHNWWNVYGANGIAQMHRAVRDRAPNVKTFVNEYGVLGSNDFAGWYQTHINQLRDAGFTQNLGDVVNGVGVQYYPGSLGEFNAQFVMQGMQNLSAQGLPITLTELGVHDPTSPADAATIINGMMTMIFGNANANGFFMWGFHSENGDTNLFAKAGELFQVNTANWASWTITDAGKIWQDRLGIQDWDANPNNAWNTLQNLLADANSAIDISGGFYGDYYLSGQRTDILNAQWMPYDMTLAKGTASYNTTLAKPPDWFFWKTNGSGTWSTAGNWTDAPQSNTVPNGAGLTAYFGSSATTYDMGFVNGLPSAPGTGATTTTNITNPVTVTVSSNVTAGMLVFNNASSYTINASGGAGIALQGYNNASGHVAAICVNNGNHMINAPLTLVDDTTVTVVNAANTLTVSNLQASSADLTKAGAGKLQVNNVRAQTLNVNAGILKIAQIGSSAGTSRVTGLSIAGSAKLDLSDNKLVIAAGYVGSWDGTQYTGVTGLIQSGRGDGTWNGAGGLLTTMTDATSGVLTTLAIATADETGYAGGTFGEIPVNSGDVLVMYTWGGDADLSGELNGDDYFFIDSNVLAQTSGFHNGDFDYNGEINGDDYFILDSNILFAQNSPPFSTGAGGSLAAIPEPAALLWAGLIALGLRRRRC